MTTKERFLRVIHYQPVDRIPHFEFGYWSELKLDWMNKKYLPENFKNEINKLSLESKDSEYPAGIWFGSFIVHIRDWFGFENFAYMCHDDTDLLEEIV